MSRPSQEQIDDYVWRSRNNTYAPTRSMADEVITCLADDLKAAREELDRLRLADFDGLNKQRAELIEELSHERADNDAMAALLGHCETCACAAPSWTDAARAVLAARAKRMGETRGKR